VEELRILVQTEQVQGAVGAVAVVEEELPVLVQTMQAQVAAEGEEATTRTSINEVFNNTRMQKFSRGPELPNPLLHLAY
jgi:hypothetical protein